MKNVNDNSSILSVVNILDKMPNFIQKNKVISVKNIYKQTYVYSPKDKNEDILFFPNKHGFKARLGLVIYKSFIEKPQSTKVEGTLNNEKIFCEEDEKYMVNIYSRQKTVQPVIKILQKGLPRIYEFSLSQNESFLNKYHNYEKELLNYMKDVYKDGKIQKINIKKIKIISEYNFNLSYDYENFNFVVTDNKNTCVIFKDLVEINFLFHQNKIYKSLYTICKELMSVITDIKAKTDLYSSFLKELSSLTILGFYNDLKNEVVFFGLVNNIKEFEECCLPFSDIEDFFFRYNLPYQKAVTLKSDLVDYGQFMNELEYIYRTISEDFSTFQSYGALIMIECERRNEILVSFKILNQETKLIKKLKKIKYLSLAFCSESEEDENSRTSDREISKSPHHSKLRLKTAVSPIKTFDVINKVMILLNHYKLPRPDNLYLKFFKDMRKKETIYDCMNHLDELSKSKDNKILFNNHTLTDYSILLNKRRTSLSNDKVKKNDRRISSSPENELKEERKHLRSSSSFTLRKNLAKEYEPSKAIGLLQKSLILKDYYFMNSLDKLLYNKNKGKGKRVKFIDDVYNKSLVQEIFIECFKTYNANNNFDKKSEEVCCKVSKKTECCLLF